MQLCNVWFEKREVPIEQFMNYNKINGQYVLKEIQRVWEEKNL